MEALLLRRVSVRRVKRWFDKYLRYCCAGNELGNSGFLLRNFILCFAKCENFGHPAVFYVIVIWFSFFMMSKMMSLCGRMRYFSHIFAKKGGLLCLYSV